MNRVVLLCAVVVVSISCPAAFAGQSPADKSALRPGQSDSGPYSFTEVMIPMRDGIRLQTVIIAPNGIIGLFRARRQGSGR